jgi:hypothetical protein
VDDRCICRSAERGVVSGVGGRAGCNKWAMRGAKQYK